MTLTITIECDNAAFEDRGEVSRILRELADKIDGYQICDIDETPIRDVNGNRVGVCRVE